MATRKSGNCKTEIRVTKKLPNRGDHIFGAYILRKTNICFVDKRIFSAFAILQLFEFESGCEDDVEEISMLRQKCMKA